MPLQIKMMLAHQYRAVHALNHPAADRHAGATGIGDQRLSKHAWTELRQTICLMQIEPPVRLMLACKLEHGGCQWMLRFS